MDSNLKSYDDNRGSLVPIYFNDISFTPKRIFIVKNCPINTIRGNHAHFETQQLLICIKGKIEVMIDNGIDKKITIINENESILINNLIWDSQKFLTDNDILMVICSTEYNKNDYIFDYSEFLKIKNNNKINDKNKKITK